MFWNRDNAWFFFSTGPRKKVIFWCKCAEHSYNKLWTRPYFSLLLPYLSSLLWLLIPHSSPAFSPVCSWVPISKGSSESVFSSPGMTKFHGNNWWCHLSSWSCIEQRSQRNESQKLLFKSSDKKDRSSYTAILNWNLQGYRNGFITSLSYFVFICSFNSYTLKQKKSIVKIFSHKIIKGTR